ncbi:MAG: Gx transporter family protein, partial [Treponema sp.]|nr:Gx transporter family protein [Treponema sp.]
MPSKIKKNQDIRLLTFFASLCLYLSAIEYAIPKPLPFLRLGLANLPILLGLEVFPVATVLLLTLLKILLQA